MNLKPLFKKRKDWKEVRNFKHADYSNCYEYAKIRDPYITMSFFNNKKYLLSKSLPNYYPTTYLIRDGQLISSSTPIPPDDSSRWFLKPCGGYGGKGIRVLNKIEEYKNFVNASGKYIVQKEVIPKLIGGRKFDLRMYMVIVFFQGVNYFFLNQDGFTRICNAQYTQNKTSNKSNLTNVCYGVDTMDLESLRKNYLLISTLDFYSKAMPKMNQMMTEVAKEITHDFRHKTSGFTFIGLDIILDQNTNPYILELNNKVGFKTNKFSPIIKKFHLAIFNDIIDSIFIPLTNKSPPQEVGGWKLIYQDTR